jgi:hypothetical protein
MRRLLILLCSCAAEANPSPPVAGSDAGPVVLELFTSQGCSSCPPADRLLSSFVKDGQVAGRQVAALSFHVDYWNDLGWADPFSLPAWTERQRQYAQALGDNRVYTPELVIAGGSGFVGSNSDWIRAAIREAPRITKLATTATWAADHVDITATAPADADVLVALYEGSKSTKVTRGENTGETLGNAHVVRRLERVAAAGQRGTLTLKLDPRWSSVGAIAFAQRADKRIVASAILR